MPVLSILFFLSALLIALSVMAHMVASHGDQIVQALSGRGSLGARSGGSLSAGVSFGGPASNDDGGPAKAVSRATASIQAGALPLAA
jgi:hypothetical protein